MEMLPVILLVNLEQVHLVYPEVRNRITIPEPEIVLMSNKKYILIINLDILLVSAIVI